MLCFPIWKLAHWISLTPEIKLVFILEVHELIHGRHLLENYWSSKVGLSESITSKMHSSVFRGAVRHGLALNRFTQMAY